MDLIKEIKREVRDLIAMYKIWRSKPTSTFKEISDTYRKRPILDKARDAAHEMLLRDKYMFNETCNAVFGKAGRKDRKEIEKVASKITDEDQKINFLEQKVRKNIMEYLAENSAPDIKSSLVLTTLIIDLERLGDYTKDISKITLIDPIDLHDKKYLKDVLELKNTLLQMFELSELAFIESDKKAAVKVSSMNKKFRETTNKMLLRISKEREEYHEDIIFYILVTRYFRRVSAHLENISSSAIKSFPYLGFKERKK